MTNAEAQFNKSLRPRKPEGSLGRTAQDVHLDSHTAPELCGVGHGETSIKWDITEESRWCRAGVLAALESRSPARWSVVTEWLDDGYVLGHSPSIAFRHLPPKKDVVNQRLESGSRLSAHPEIFPVSNSVQILQKSFGRDSINRGHTGVCIYCP